MPPVLFVLAGRGGAAGASPRKSRPRSESLGFDAFGGAGADLGGTCDGPGPVVLALGGRSSPPIRSAWGGGGTGLRDDPWCPTELFRIDSFLSMVCFSFTMLSGTSSSPSTSKLAGLGMGPSMTHRFSSYLVLMKFSILTSDGT